MKFVVIRSYDNYVPAHIDMGLLKEEGIESWLQDEHSVTVNPALTNAVGGIKLLVLKDQAETAMTILIKRRAAWLGRQVCPNCGSSSFISKTTSVQARSWLDAVVVLLLGKSALGTENNYHCSQCGAVFKTPATREPQEQHIPD